MSWELRLGDCLDPVTGLASITGVDAVITDPPYGISDTPLRDQKGGKRAGSTKTYTLARSNNWHAESEWDKAIDPAWCAAVCKAAPLVIWFGNWRKRAEVEAAMPHPIRCEIIWAKDCHTAPACPVAPQDERIWVFSAGAVRPREFAPSVWPVPVIPTWAHKHHKNEKPLALMEKLIRVFTDPGALVVDPFAGSGTTGVAAAKLGRRFLGWEKKPEHHAVALKRLNAAREQMTLFGGAA